MILSTPLGLITPELSMHIELRMGLSTVLRLANIVMTTRWKHFRFLNGLIGKLLKLNKIVLKKWLVKCHN